MTEINTDIAIIGAGSGGLTVAAGAAQMGAKVVLIEKHKMGGDCLNYGCVPSKALLAASNQARELNTNFGIKGTKPKVDYVKVMQHVQKVIAKIEPHDSEERFASLGVNVIKGAAKFIGKKAVQVADKIVCAKYFIIATGSSPIIPAIPGLRDSFYFTNENIFDNKQLPEHLLVIGGGPIGMEMAQAHRLLGSKVTVVDMAAVLPHNDTEAVKIVRHRFLADGINFREFIKINKVHKKGKDIILDVELPGGSPFKITGSHLLVAAGRHANLNNLDLDKAGVKRHLKGINVNRRLQTSNKRIYAIGDIASPYQFTHVATYQAGIVIRNILFKIPAKVDYKAIPWVTYTTPEIAHCGLIKEEAFSKYGYENVRILRFEYKDNDRAQAELATEGFVKVTVLKNGRILGVGIVGKNAGELIQIWILAIKNKLKINAMAGYISPYPTLGEINKRAAGSFYTDLLFRSRKTKWLTRGLMKLPF